MPRELEERIHVLLKNQRQITSISLITDRECSMDGQLSCTFDLAQFPNLQTLSWKGLKFYHDFDSVKTYIAAYGAQLKTLRLDLIGWDSAKDIWTRGLSKITAHNFPAPENFFANTVLGLRQGEVNTPLPALRCLALSQVSFCPMEIEMIQALNVTGLHTLELLNCPGTFSWLREVVRSRKVVKLKSLELVFNPECVNLFVDESLDFVTESVTNFLRSFEGLQNLRLMLPQPTDWKIISKGISHHSSTIETLIAHNLNRTEFGGSVDGDLFFNVPDIHLLPQNKYLEFFGVSVSTQQLVVTTNHTLKDSSKLTS